MTLEEYGKNEIIMRYDDPKNLLALFENSVKRFPDSLYIGEKDKNKIYQWTTYNEIGKRVDNLRSGLDNLKILKEGDNIGIIANNRKEWIIGAFATYGLKCHWVPMYEKELFETWKYIIDDARLKVLFVSNNEIYNKIKNFKKDIETLEEIFIIESDAENSMEALEKIGKVNPVDSKIPDVSDIANLIYTSGTTGDPKGVLLTHGNFTCNSQAGQNVFPHLNNATRALNILPWAHSYAFTGELITMTAIGASIGITSVDTMSEDLLKVKPSILICVPRLFNKIYDGIHLKMDQTGGLKKKLFYMAKKAAKKKRESGKAGIMYKFLDKAVFGKIRLLFGNRLTDSLTASAKTDIEIANFFFDIGLPIYDCYGMTELSPAATMNCPTAHKLGSVGKPIEKVKVVIDKTVFGEDSDQGEIIVYGPNVMKGYHNKPEKTAAVMIEDKKGNKGVQTGDLGRLDDEGYLFITGRIKNEYKLQNGKYIHPAAIEEYLKLLPWISNAMVYGDGKEFNVALIVPDMEVAKRYAETMDLTIKDPKKLIQQKELQDLISKEIKAHLKQKFGNYEIPRKFSFLTEDFTLENGMLTQTLKLKRRDVLKKYGNLLNSMYKKIK